MKALTPRAETRQLPWPSAHTYSLPSLYPMCAFISGSKNSRFAAIVSRIAASILNGCTVRPVISD